MESPTTELGQGGETRENTIVDRVLPWFIALWVVTSLVAWALIWRFDFDGNNAWERVLTGLVALGFTAFYTAIPFSLLFTAVSFVGDWWEERREEADLRDWQQKPAGRDEREWREERWRKLSNEQRRGKGG